MDATSSAQYESTVRDTVPDFEQVRANVWALPLAMPFDTVPYGITYLIRDDVGALHVIDPGWESEDNWGALRFAIRRTGCSVDDIATIVVTHLHPDHTGMAERLRSASGGRILMHRTEQAMVTATGEHSAPAPDLAAWGVPPDRRAELELVVAATDEVPHIIADSLLDDGDAIAIPGRDLAVMLTPGHTRGSICLVQPDENLVYTGDTVLPASHPTLGRGGLIDGNPIDDYLSALGRLAALPGNLEVCPGHGYRFTGLGDRSRRTAAHHERRTDEVERVMLAARDATVWRVAERLTWAPGFGQLHGYYLLTGLVQTAMHVDRVRRRNS